MKRRSILSSSLAVLTAGMVGCRFETPHGSIETKPVRRSRPWQESPLPPRTLASRKEGWEHTYDTHPWMDWFGSTHSGVEEIDGSWTFYESNLSDLFDYRHASDYHCGNVRVVMPDGSEPWRVG